MAAATFGAFVAAHRRRRRITQEKLAHAIGLKGQPGVANIELGYCDGRKHFAAIAQVLEIPDEQWPFALRLPLSLDTAA